MLCICTGSFYVLYWVTNSSIGPLGIETFLAVRIVKSQRLEVNCQETNRCDVLEGIVSCTTYMCFHRKHINQYYHISNLLLQSNTCLFIYFAYYSINTKSHINLWRTSIISWNPNMMALNLCKTCLHQI